MMKSHPMWSYFRRAISLEGRLFLFLVCVVIIAGACTPRTAVNKAPLEDQGEVILYLQPLPQDSHRFRFHISSVTAIDTDGKEHALSMDLTEIRGAEMVEGQRHLASAVLPPGTYTGFMVSIGEALLQTEEGEVALFVSEEPTRIQHKFKLDRKQVLAIFISFDPGMSLIDGFRFSPVFTVKTFSRQLINLIGYVSNSESNNITVFNKNTMEVTDVIATRQGPRGIALDQMEQLVYAAISGSNMIEIIDMSLGNIFARIPLFPGDEPQELALTPDGELLVALNSGSRTLSVINARSKFEMRRFSVGEGPTSVVLNPSGVTAYVMNSLSSSISVVEISRDQTPFTMSVDAMPLRGVFNRTGDRLFVITRDSPNLLVIDVTSFSIVERIFVGGGARSIHVDTRTDLIYVGMDIGGIHIVDPRSLMYSDIIPYDGAIQDMTIDDDENMLFALVPEKKTLLKINMISKHVLSEIPLEGGAYAVTVMRER